MEFSNWKLRRQIMASEAPDCVKFGMLVIVDNIDWNSGSKKFSSKTHYHNWLRRIADQYPLQETVTGSESTLEVWEGYRLVVEAMKHLGFAYMVNGHLQLVMHKDAWDEEPAEATA